MDTQGRATARGRARGGRASRGPPSQAEGGGMRRPGEGTGAPPQQRARAPPSAAPSYAQMGAQGGPRPQQPPPQSAWGPPPSGRASRQPADVAGVTTQMQQASIHAPSSTGGSVGSGSASGSGPAEGGNGVASVGRGALRGRRVIPETNVHTRPAHVVSKQGTSGARQQLKANYFKLETVTDWCLYQYRVDFAPEEDRTMVRKGLLRHHRETLGGYIFDGTMMFTSHRLVPDPMTLTSQRTGDGVNFTITVKLVGDLSKGDYHYIQFFNILMRKCLDTLDLQLVGRDFYDARAKKEVREYKLELWPGYKTSIRQHESDILMCAEVTFKVMRQDTVFEVLQTSYDRDRNNWKRTFMEAVVGCVVLTDYNNKTYRVDDVDFDSNPQKTFKKKTGEEISYAQYYNDRYQLRIRDNTQPMLVSRAKARDVRAGMSETIYLIPELCRMTGLTDDMRNNFHLMKALAVHTRVAPDARMEKLREFSRRLRTNDQCTKDLQEWNLKLGDDLVNVPGRELPLEKILVGNGGTQMPDDKFDWSAAFRNKPMLSLQALNKWVVVVPQRMMQDCKSFVDTLSRVSSGMRFTLAQPMVKEIPDDRAGSYVQALTQILDQHQPQLIMCAVPNNRGDRYSAIKKKCCVDRAVPTQVIVGKNLTSRGVMSIASKVAIQMNCKIGGSPWSVEVPLNGLMVVGFDVCHDTANKSQSYGAMVASLDKPMSKYFSAVSAHQSGEELSNDLSLNIVKALHKFKALHNELPQRIFVYRDGVGEGQLPQVFNHEVELVKQRLAEAYSGQQPRLSYIIVTKRINTRIFANPRGPLKGNPRSGTVVDDVITDPTKYDFYIVSQSVNQGTVAPTSYNVLHDTSGMDADKIQRLTYKLCHMYFNWSGTVRVPAPCQYAHKLAFLVGQSLHREPSRGLEDLLYFL